jgi:hypothetical protein
MVSTICEVASVEPSSTITTSDRPHADCESMSATRSTDRPIQDGSLNTGITTESDGSEDSEVMKRDGFDRNGGKLALCWTLVVYCTGCWLNVQVVLSGSDYRLT